MAIRSFDDEENENGDLNSENFIDLFRDAGLREMISLIGTYRNYLNLLSVKIGNEDRM